MHLGVHSGAEILLWNIINPICFRSRLGEFQMTSNHPAIQVSDVVKLAAFQTMLGHEIHAGVQKTLFAAVAAINT